MSSRSCRLIQIIQILGVLHYPACKLSQWPNIWQQKGACTIDFKTEWMTLKWCVQSPTYGPLPVCIHWRFSTCLEISIFDMLQRFAKLLRDGSTMVLNVNNCMVAIIYGSGDPSKLVDDGSLLDGSSICYGCQNEGATCRANVINFSDKHQSRAGARAK